MTVLTSRIRKVDIRFFFQLKNQNRSLGWRLDDAAALSGTCRGKLFHFGNFSLIFKQPRFHNFLQVQFQLSLWFELEKPSKNKIVQLVVLVIHRNTNMWENRQNWTLCTNLFGLESILSIIARSLWPRSSTIKYGNLAQFYMSISLSTKVDGGDGERWRL